MEAERELPAGAGRGFSRRASARLSRHSATLTLVVRRPAMGAAVAATAVRSWLAGARQSARVRRPQRYGAAAVRARRGVVPPTYLPKLQSAGRRDHRRVTPVVRDAGPEAALGGADFAGRDYRVAGDERTGRWFGSGIAAHACGARRQRLRGQRTKGVDV